MKIRNHFIIAATAVVFALLGVIYYSLEGPGDKVKYQESSRNYENPEARAELEFMQLKNPKTGKIPEGIAEKELEFVKNIPSRTDYRLAKSRIYKNYEWESIGPRNISGRTRALTYDIRNENVLIAAGVSGGVFKSIDGGQSWYRVTDKSIRHSVASIAQDTRPGFEDNWYYSSGEAYGNSAGTTGAKYYGDGVYRSTNNGESWERIESTYSNTVNLTSPLQASYRIQHDPSNENESELYLASFGLILRSSDGGESWNATLGSINSNAPYFTDVEVTSGGVVYATLSKHSMEGEANADVYGIFRSEDGITWEDITPADFPEATRRIVLDTYAANENILYFLAETPEAGRSDHTIWRYEYDEQGGAWDNRSSAIPSDSTNPNMNFSSQGSYDLVVSVKPDDENYVFIGGTSVFRSTDGFQNYENVDHVGGYDLTKDNFPLYDNHWVDQHVILFSKQNPDVLYVGNDGGVYKSADITAETVEWVHLNDNYITSQFYDIAIDEFTPGDEFIIGGLQDRGNWFSNSLSNSSIWEPIKIGGDGTYSEVVQGGDTVYFSFQSGRIHRRVFDGQSYSYTRVDDGNGWYYLFVNPFLLDPNNQSKMYAANAFGVMRNDNLSEIPENENIWEPTDSNWVQIEFSEDAVPTTALDISRVPANILYAGRLNGEMYRLNNASSDDPEILYVTGDNFPEGYISDIWVDPTDADKVLISFSNYGIPSLFYSSNGGQDWSDVSGNLEEFPDGSGNGPSTRTVDALIVDGQPVYFVGTSVGLYSTTELNGSSTEWQYEGGNTIGNVVVYSLETRTIDGTVFAATHGSGIYKSTITTGVDDEAVRNSISLSQNYPNPFNPTTKIEYYIPNAAKVELKIYDVLGQEVTTLVNSLKNSGNHSVEFNASGLASGTYIYRLQTGDFAVNKKMILLK